MKTAILLRGLSYREAHTTSAGVAQAVDWKWTRSSIRERLISSFPDSDVFLTSYRSADEARLVEYFNPVACLFHKYSDDGPSEMDCLLEGLRMVRRSRECYQGVLVSRFDLHFYEPLTQWNFDYSKINFLYREYSEKVFQAQGKCANGVWFIAAAYLDAFIAACERLNSMVEADFADMTVYEEPFEYAVNLRQITHHIYLTLSQTVPAESIHFVRSGYFHSLGRRDLCPYYKLVRSEQEAPTVDNQFITLLGGVIYEIRILLKMPLDEVATLARLPSWVIDKVEDGEHNLTYIELCRIASALGSEPWVMLHAAEEARRKTGPRGA